MRYFRSTGKIQHRGGDQRFTGIGKQVARNISKADHPWPRRSRLDFTQSCDRSRITSIVAPLHVHRDQAEWIYVMTGEFLAEVGGERTRLKTGDSLLCHRMSSYDLLEDGRKGTSLSDSGTVFFNFS